MKKNILKHRSWELTKDELIEKQKIVRKNMWMTMILFIFTYLMSFCFYFMGYYFTSILAMSLTILVMIIIALQKYYELSLSPIIEIRNLEERLK